MTPQYPKPSAHDVVTGFWTPNSVDINLYAGNTFGTTIGIMAQDRDASGNTAECMKGVGETKNASIRGEFYTRLIHYFELEEEKKIDIGCRATLLDYGGAGAIGSGAYWVPDYSNSSKRCKLVHYESKYSIYNADDYKRCVC